MMNNNESRRQEVSPTGVRSAGKRKQKRKEAIVVFPDPKLADEFAMKLVNMGIRCLDCFCEQRQKDIVWVPGMSTKELKLFLKGIK